jgi:hypothetical protein
VNWFASPRCPRPKQRLKARTLIRRCRPQRVSAEHIGGAGGDLLSIAFEAHANLSIAAFTSTVRPDSDDGGRFDFCSGQLCRGMLP